MSPRRLAALPLLPPVLGLLLGCDNVVHVAVKMGDCSLDVVRTVGSVHAVLKRDDGWTWERRCASTVDPVATMDDISELLAASFTFREVPTGGRWTLAVRGFLDSACTQPVFCGRTRGLTLPPPGDRIEIRINCPPIYSDDTDYKDCTRE